MEDGSFVESSVIKAVIQGEARVGKTSFKCMLSNDKYTDNRSTNCIESPCVAIKCYGHTSGKWERYDEERMEVTVISEIHYRAEKHAKESRSAVPKGKVKSITKQDHKKGSTTHSTPTKQGDALPAVTIELTTDRDHEAGADLGGGGLWGCNPPKTSRIKKLLLIFKCTYFSSG